MLQIERSKIYGGWLVVEYLGRSPSAAGGALWDCECTACKAHKPIRGADLRRGKLPLCSNCCRKCGRTRAQVVFNGNKRICVECDHKRIADWRLRSGYTDALRKWRAANPERRKKYRTTERDRIQSSPYVFLDRMLKAKVRLFRHQPRGQHPRYRQKSRRPELAKVEITAEFLHSLWDRQGGLCAITGMPMAHRFNDLRSVSIDRKDSAGGYTEGNVQLVCRWANLAKGRFSDADIRAVLDEYTAHSKPRSEDVPQNPDNLP